MVKGEKYEKRIEVRSVSVCLSVSLFICMCVCMGGEAICYMTDIDYIPSVGRLDHGQPQERDRMRAKEQRTGRGLFEELLSSSKTECMVSFPWY